MKKIIILSIFLLVALSSYATAAFNPTLITTYQDVAPADSIEGARGMQVDATRKIAYISATTDDSLTAINFSNSSSFSVYGSVNDAAPIGSVDGIWFGTLDSNNIFYAPSGTDSTTAWYNVTAGTFVFMNDTAADTAGAGSQQGENDVAIVNTATKKWLITGGLTDDTVSSFDVTNPWVRPAVTNSFNDASGACSVDGMYDMYNIPGTTYFLAAATVDSYITLLNVSDAGAIACIGSGYTDTADAGSIEGIQYMYYDTAAGYVYTTSPTDGYLTILTDVAGGTPTLVGSVGGMTTPVSVSNVYTTGSEKYVFVGSSTAAQNITIINVTDPANPAILSVFSETSGTCVYNGVYSLFVDGDYLYASSGVDGCFYSISLFSVDTCTCPGSGNNWEINMADSCSIVDTCNLGAGNITFIGTGTTTFNAAISSKNLEYPVTDQTLFIGSNTIITVG